MKVIIAGSRDHITYEDVVDAVAASGWQYAISEVVSGAARGADTFGEQWAKSCSCPVKQFPADWKNLGKKAGFMRNQDMGEYADALIAVWDGESKGTQHMIGVANSLDIPVYIHRIVKKEENMLEVLNFEYDPTIPDSEIYAAIERHCEHSKRQFDALPDHIKAKAIALRNKRFGIP